MSLQRPAPYTSFDRVSNYSETWRTQGVVATAMASLVLASSATLAVPSPLDAQEGRFDNRRELNEHTFIPNSVIPDPFVASWVRSATGFGIAFDLSVPVRNPLDGEQIGTLDGDIAFLALDFEYQQAFSRRLVFRLSGSGAARVGTNEQSLLSSGINALYGFGLGATVRIVESSKVALSAVGDFRWNQVYAVSLFDFLREVIENGFEPGSDKNLLNDGVNRTGSLGARLAYSPSAPVGFTAITELGVACPFAQERDSRGLFRFGGTVAVDFGARTSVPIGLQVGFLLGELQRVFR